MSVALCKWDDAVSGEDGHNVYLLKPDTSIFGQHNISLITSNEYKLTNLSPGAYSAYGTTVKGGKETGPSNIANFVIEFGDYYIPTGATSTVVDQENGDVDFSWNYVPGITHFNFYLEIGGTYVKQNSSPLYSPEISLSGLESGSYNWKVSSVYDGEEVFNDVETVTITPSTPTNTQSSDFSASDAYANETGLTTSDFGNQFTVLTSFRVNSFPSGDNQVMGIWGVHAPNDAERCYLAFQEDNSENTMLFGIGADGANRSDNSKYKVRAGDKIFVACTVDLTAGEAKFYINGELHTTVTSGVAVSSTYEWVIGARNFEGTIEDNFSADVDIGYISVIQDVLTLSEQNNLFEDMEGLQTHANAFRLWVFESDLTSTEDDYVNGATLNYNGSVATAPVVNNYFYEGTFLRDSLTVGSGETLDIYGKVILNVSGNVQIDGTIDGDNNGHPRPSETTDHADGIGPGAGIGQANDGGTGASYGGLAGTAPDAESAVASTYGSETAQSIEKGSSGANGDDVTETIGFGGAGGAGLYIDCAGDITITGTAVITMNGENGGDGGASLRGGGGGSGGGIVFEGVDVTINSGAVLRCNGAIAGTSGNSGDEGNDCGGCGGGGRLKIFHSGTLTNNGTLEVNGGVISSLYAAITTTNYDGDNGTTHSENIS